MAPNAGGEPEGQLAKALQAEFGNFADFKAQFEKAAMDVLVPAGPGWSRKAVN